MTAWLVSHRASLVTHHVLLCHVLVSGVLVYLATISVVTPKTLFLNASCARLQFDSCDETYTPRAVYKGCTRFFRGKLNYRPDPQLFSYPNSSMYQHLSPTVTCFLVKVYRKLVNQRGFSKEWPGSLAMCLLSGTPHFIDLFGINWLLTELLLNACRMRLIHEPERDSY